MDRRAHARIQALRAHAAQRGGTEALDARVIHGLTAVFTFGLDALEFGVYRRVKTPGLDRMRLTSFPSCARVPHEMLFLPAASRPTQRGEGIFFFGRSEFYGADES